MRTKKIVVVLMTLLLVALLFGEAEKNFLWEIEKGDTKVYLMGSIHLMKPEVYPLTSIIEEAFEESDVLIVEVDATKLDMNSVQKMIMEKGSFQDETTLKSVLSDEHYKKLSEEFAASGVMTIEMLDKSKPWYVLLNLGVIRIMKLGMDANLGIDLHFLNKAKENKEIIELETADFQIKLLSGLEDDVQLNLLEESIDDPKETADIIGKIIKAWQFGDTESIDELIVERVKKVPELNSFYEKMFLERNITMTGKILEFIQKQDGKTYFVVVGAGHYVGEDGILNLLEKKGYKAIQR
ncbi:MAG: TraB/GumN family protein [Candidatus Cloacimonetes bacterium]|nr:TraB/GumN family protein [Candidatus Cloacimonadota bacterium]